MRLHNAPRKKLLLIALAAPMMFMMGQFIMGGQDYLALSPGMQELQQIEQQGAIQSLSTIEPAAGHVKIKAQRNVYHLGLNFDEVSLPQPKFWAPKKTEERKAASILKGLDSYKKKSKPARKLSSLDKFISFKPPVDGPVTVTIIIDDMGMGQSTKNVLGIKGGPLTLSYLPYAPNISEQVLRATKADHELMMHIPMQPLDAKQNPGPDVLKTGMKKKAFKKLLNKNLDQFDDYVGINNHMGSKLTQDSNSMKWVMETLKERGVFFVDSKTIPNSIAADTAASFSVPHEARDVFLDHNTDIESVRAALKTLENVARIKGHAIAIGHPKPATIQGLKEWIPTLKEKGIRLVTASTVVKKVKPVPALLSAKAKQIKSYVNEIHYQ